jgi:hypothetical protein
MSGVEKDPPFIDNGEGLPTSDSVVEALGMFGLDRLADLPVRYGEHAGTMVDLIARCRIERLTQNWPKGFITQVIGTATQAGEESPESA